MSEGQSHHLLIASNSVLTCAATYFHNLIFYTLLESSLIISGPDIHFPFLSLPLEMPSFLSQSEFDGNDECSLITWRF